VQHEVVADTDVAICWQKNGGRGTSSESFGWIPARDSVSPDGSLRPPEDGGGV